MRQVFMLDTNVLLFDPRAFFAFGHNDVVIPMVVLEEMDRFKREMSENGRHARHFARLIDELRKGGELSKGVPLPNGGRLSVEWGGNQTLPIELPFDQADHRMLALAIELKKEVPRRPVVFVTKDVNLRIKADALGILAEDYDPGLPQESEVGGYTGVATRELMHADLEVFYAQKKWQPPDPDWGVQLKPHQYLLLTAKDQPSQSALGRWSREEGVVLPLIQPPEGLWGVFPKNKEQSFAVDALLNDQISLVSLVGKAGTGKTLLAVAAGLMKTVDAGVYHRLLVSRPVFPLGRDIGFLPGDIDEKLNPWMQPIYDNIDFLLGGGSRAQAHRGAGKGCQELMTQGLLQIEPLTYIRGRSIPQQYLIVDEAQNLTPHEIKTIITRAGIGTKVVLTGDPDQIDNPYVDAVNNGLVHLVERFQDQVLSAHVTLLQGERSALSELASQLL